MNHIPVVNEEQRARYNGPTTTVEPEKKKPAAPKKPAPKAPAKK